MPRTSRILVLSAALLCIASPSFADEFFGAAKSKQRGDPFKDAVEKITVSLEPAEAKRGQTVTWKVTVKLAPGWHTYALKQTEKDFESSVTTFEFPDSADIKWVGRISEPPSLQKLEGGKTVLQHEDEVTWSRHLVVRPGAQPGKKILQAKVRLVVCNERGCLPPEDVPLTAELTITDGQVPVEDKYFQAVTGGGSKASPSESTQPVPEKRGEAPRSQVPANTEANGESTGLLAFLLQGVFWGAVSLVTPCVFPMIPITVSFFLKQSEQEHHRPVTMALVYSATIVVVLSLAAMLLLEFFQDLSQHWGTNFALGALFFFFAFSLFGMYEIRLPAGLARFTSAHEGQGGIAGTFFMALTFTIISFTCVAPFLGGFAGLAAQSRPWWHNALGALAFSATFASPFFLLALFPTVIRTLPRSGSWLNTVKVVMGFVELAAGLKFLRAGELFFDQEGILTYDLVLGMYVALSILCGLYLLNLFRLPHDTPVEHLGVSRLLFSIVFLSLGCYLLPGLVGQRPYGRVFNWLDSFLLPTSEESARFARGGSSDKAATALAWTGNLDKGLESARDQNRLVFIDFTGET